MAVIHHELVVLLVVASILRAVDRFMPLGQAFLQGINVYGSAVKMHATEVAYMIGQRGKMTVEEATAAATRILEASKYHISEALPASAMKDFENLSTLFFSGVITLLVGGLASVLSCVRGTPQHEMSFIALAVCAGTCLFILFLRIIGSGGATSSAQSNQSLLRQLGVAAAAVSVVTSLLVMFAPDSVFDFSLRRGLREAASKSNLFISLLVDVPADKKQEPWYAFTYLVIALLCGLVTFTLVIPAVLHTRSLAKQLRDEATPQWKKATLLVSFVLPLLLASTWIRPVLGNSLLPPDLVKCSADALARDCTATPHAGEFFLTETQWFSFRISGVLLACVLHVVVTRWNMEASLRRARDDQVDALVEFVSVPSVREDFDLGAHLNNKAAEPLNSMNAVASLLLAPFLFLAMLALAAIRKGELDTLYTCPAVQYTMESVGLPRHTFAVPGNATHQLSDLDLALQRALSTAFPRLPDVQNVHLVSPTLWRPVLSILIWFFLVSWFVLTALGLSYWNLSLGSNKLRLQETAADAATAVAAGRDKKQSKGSRKGKVVRKGRAEGEKGTKQS